MIDEGDKVAVFVAVGGTDEGVVDGTGDGVALGATIVFARAVAVGGTSARRVGVAVTDVQPTSPKMASPAMIQDALATFIRSAAKVIQNESFA